MTVKPLIEHLNELRSRLIVILVFFFVVFFFGFLGSNFIIERVINDLIITENIKLIVPDFILHFLFFFSFIIQNLRVNYEKIDNL